jgi:colicin import membrane protein
MSQAALAHDALLPRAPGGNAAGAFLALGVHALLIVALTTAVDWRMRAPDVVSAELWAELPQAAAPRQEEQPAAVPVPPVPVPVPEAQAPAPRPTAPPPEARAAEVDIAIEREARRKQAAANRNAQAEADAEKLRTAAEKKKTAAEARRRELAASEAKAEDERLARQREDNLRRIIGQAGAAAGRGTTATQDAAPSAAYSGKLVALIRSNSVFTGNDADNAAAEVEVRASPNGTIIARRLLKSSGHADWDDAVLRAIDRTGTLPRDVDGRVPQTLIIAFRPRE